MSTRSYSTDICCETTQPQQTAGCMQVYVHRIRKYIGAYMVHLKGKVDAIVMSAGVGENSPPVRKLLLADLEVGELASSLSESVNNYPGAVYIPHS